MYQPTLSARSVGDLLDSAFRLYRTHFKTFIGISSVVLVPFTVLQIVALAAPSLMGLLTIVQTILLISLLASTLTAASAAVYLAQPISIQSAYQAGKRRWLSVWASSFLQGLIIAVPFVLITCVVASIGIQNRISSPATGTVVIFGALIVLALPYLLFFITRYAAAIPAVVIEDVNAGPSLKRSSQLVQGTFWHVFWCVLATGLLVFFISQLPAFLANVFIPFVSSNLVTPLRVAGIVLTQLGLILALPFQYLVYTLLYYDLRIRKEGFDLELRAQVEPPPSAPAMSEL